MSKPNKVKRAIQKDIDDITTILDDNTKSFEELKNLHIKIDGKYQGVISNWGRSMFNWSDFAGFDYNYIDEDEIKENLYSMKSKLEGYLQGYDMRIFEKNINANSKPTFVNYNNNQNVNKNKNENEIKIDFDTINDNIKNMESLTGEETDKILDIIEELRIIYNSKENRKLKWEKAKKIAQWTLDKSVDVAIQILPILMGIVK